MTTEEAPLPALPPPWSVDRVQAWYKSHSSSWKQGLNFIPSTAVNQIEMWKTYDASTIQRELQWAADLHYNALRVFLHDVMYQEEGTVFLDKVDGFLTTAYNMGFTTILVLLEGIWDPYPQYTQQVLPPIPRVHNSRWVQSPGATILQNETAWEDKVKPYIQAIVQRFGHDTQRVLLFDIMDQPENANVLSYGAMGTRIPATQAYYGTELDPLTKVTIIQKFIPQVLQWVHDVSVDRQVPITIADWGGTDLDPTTTTPQQQSAAVWLQQVYLQNSDVITFHQYSTPNVVLAKLDELQTQFPGRPVILSSFMARDDGCTIEPLLGELYAQNVWALQWGWVSGKTQTIYNSNSWNQLYTSLPDLWHHDMLWPNGTVYKESEKQYLLSFRQNHNQNKRSSSSSSSTGISLVAGKNRTMLIFSIIIVIASFTLTWLYYYRRQRNQQEEIQIRRSTIQDSLNVVTHADDDDDKNETEGYELNEFT
jgi:hypothetical protein